jgi:hypothetical protein
MAATNGGIKMEMGIRLSIMEAVDQKLILPYASGSCLTNAQIHTCKT